MCVERVMFSASTGVIVIRMSIFLLLALPLGTTMSWSQANPPPISDEIVLDHGDRYQEDVHQSYRCAIAVADTMTLLTYWHWYGEGGIGYRRGLSGEEIDINQNEFGCERIWDGAYDMSHFDGLGWKLLYVTREGSGPRILKACNIEPATLQSTMGELEIDRISNGYITCPTIASAGDQHIVAWVESSGTSLYTARISRDLELLEQDPVLVSSNVRHGGTTLAMTETGGLIAWLSPGRQVIIQRLNSLGVPIGEVRSLGHAEDWASPDLDVCSFGDGFLIAWNGESSVRYAVLDSTGATLHVAAVEPESRSMEGLAVCAADSVGLIAWREYYEGGFPPAIMAMRVSLDGEMLAGASEVGHWWDYCCCDYDYRYGDLRNLDCAWTGETFAVLSNQRSCLVTSEKEAFDPRNRVAALCGWPEGPILAQYLTLQGDPLFDGSVLVNQRSDPGHIGVYHTDGNYLALMFDGNTDVSYMHSFLLDASGQQIGSAKRYDTPDDEDSYCSTPWDSGHTSRIRGMALRPWGEDAAVVYGYSYSWDGTLHHENQEYAVWDCVSPDGDLLGRHRVRVDWSTEVPVARPRSFDIAAGEDAVLVAYGARYSWSAPRPHYVEAVLANADGDVLRSWRVASDSSCTKPSVARLDDGYLLLWLEEASQQSTIQRAIINPSEPGSQITGTPLLESLGIHGAPYLVPGPDQVLLVFPALLEPEGTPTPTDYDIYAMRFDMDGEPIDLDPIPLCTLPGNQGNVQGIWNSNQYLITWANTDHGSYGLYGGRIGDNGAVIDSVGFLIADGVRDIGRLTSDTVGNVAVSYGSRYVRLIEDVVPLLDDDDWPWDEEQPDSTQSTTLQIGHIVPNPCRDVVRLELALPPGVEATVTIFDCVGRRLREESVGASGIGSDYVWDCSLPSGESASTGLYFLRVNVTDREGVAHETIRRALLLR